MEGKMPEGVVRLAVEPKVWGQAFTVAPLVVVGTREEDGYDLAPKHMAFPLGWDNFFAFVCSPRHATYHNAQRSLSFTVSYPRPSQVVLASLAAAPRAGWEGEKPIVQDLPTFAASQVDGPFLEDAYLFLECELDRVIDGFGENSLIIGRIVAAFAHRDALRVGEDEDEERVRGAPLLVYVDPGRYAEVRDTHAWPFPAGFER